MMDCSGYSWCGNHPSMFHESPSWSEHYRTKIQTSMELWWDRVQYKWKMAEENL